MYIVKTEQSFDSAHFLSGYDGKCSNLHGHRWRVVIEVCSDSLMDKGQYRGMVADFSDIKNDLKEMADYFDHAFIFESGTLRQSTKKALEEENFKLIETPFRPTAENLARYFYDCMSKKGYNIKSAAVYETPNNCAVYSGEGKV